MPSQTAPACDWPQRLLRLGLWDIESPAGMAERSPRFDELTLNGMFRCRAVRTTLKQPRRDDGTVTSQCEMTSQAQANKHLVPEDRRTKADLALVGMDDGHFQACWHLK